MSKSPNRLFAIIFGVVYLLVGVFGFFVTSSVSFASTVNSLRFIGILEVNPLQNLVHLFIGVVLLITGLAGIRSAKVANTTFGAVFLAWGIIGLFFAGTSANIFAINAGDNVLHFGSAAVLLVIGLGADKLASPPKTA